VTTGEQEHNEPTGRHAWHPYTHSTPSGLYAIKTIGKAEFYVPSTRPGVSTHGSPLWIDKNRLGEALVYANLSALKQGAVVEFLFLVGLGWPTSVAAEVNGIGPLSAERLMDEEKFTVCVDSEDEGLRGANEVGDLAYWTALELRDRRWKEATRNHSHTRMGPAPETESYKPLSECLLRGRGIAHNIRVLLAAGKDTSERNRSKVHQMMTSLLVLGLQLEPFQRDDSTRMLSPGLVAVLLEDAAGELLRASLCAHNLLYPTMSLDAKRLRTAQKYFRAINHKQPLSGRQRMSWDDQMATYDRHRMFSDPDSTWQAAINHGSTTGGGTIQNRARNHSSRSLCADSGLQYSHSSPQEGATLKELYLTAMQEGQLTIDGFLAAQDAEDKRSAMRKQTSTAYKDLGHRPVSASTAPLAHRPIELILTHMQDAGEEPIDIELVRGALKVLRSSAVNNIEDLAKLSEEELRRLGLQDEWTLSCLLHALREIAVQPWLLPSAMPLVGKGDLRTVLGVDAIGHSDDFEPVGTVGEFALVRAAYPHSGFYVAKVEDDRAVLMERLPLLDAYLQRVLESSAPVQQPTAGHHSGGAAPGKQSRSETNKALADALRARGKPRSGDIWERAKKLMAEGLSVEQAAEEA
jgi:hypothetical protein